MKKVIVTGGTGMIGTTLIRKLMEYGIEITVIVRPDTKRVCNLPESTMIKKVFCNIGDIISLKEKLDSNYDTFFHLAWSDTYGTGRDNAEAQEKNIKATLDAVELAFACGCKTFVGAGSQAEFGYVSGKISDDIPKNPITAYGIAKYAAGKMSRIRCEQLGIRHCWGRILSVYGPYDNDYTMVMSAIIGMSNNERMSFTKGEQVWDYIYSEDCAKALYFIALKGIHGKAYTIGSGKPRLLREYIVAIKDAINPGLEIGLGEKEYYPNQVMKLVADIDALKEDTGFKPDYSFEEGIRKTITWYKNTRRES